MKELKNSLKRNVDPLFFAFACAMLILFSVTAQALVKEIATESDNGAEMLRLVRVTH